MSEDNKYNGWANYATWRVQLEVVDDYVSQTVYGDADTAERWLNGVDVSELAQELQDYVEEVIGFEQRDGLVWNYALAFLSEVQWYELAEHAKQAAKEALQAFDEDDKLASVV
jgi:hypothetical protein